MRISWPITVHVWWAFFWRAVLLGVSAGAVAGFVAGAAAALAGRPESAADWGGVAGWVVSLPASMLAMKKGLEAKLSRLLDAARDTSVR
jgi:hypothetical protein